MHEFKHPKFYKELRKRNKAARIPPTSSGQAASDQAISDSPESRVRDSVRPGPGHKPQASSSKPQAPSSLNNKPQASSPKQQASSSKPQASSSKIL